MHWVERYEFDSDDKVGLGDWVNKEWFEKHDPEMINSIMTVIFQDGDDVWIDKGWVGVECLELVEDVNEFLRLLDNRPPHTRDFSRELGGQVSAYISNIS